MRVEIRDWLRARKELIEQTILSAAENYFSDYVDKNNFVYDLNQCELESLNLTNGKDLCYDRPSIGLSYSLWYLGRRINTSMTFMIDLVVDAIQDKKPIEILDLGAGTGAVQIALGLCLSAAKALGYELPKSKMINIDISPFMLSYHRDYLWTAFNKSFPTTTLVATNYSVNSWINSDETLLQTPVIVASYLFDHKENQREVTEKFKSFVKILKPDKVVLITSKQPNKMKFLDSASAFISGGVYVNSPVTSALLFRGNIPSFQEFRKTKNNTIGTNFSTWRPPSWDEYSFYARIMTKKERELAFDHAENKKVLEKIDLYIPEIAVRRDIILNKQQKKAAEIDNPRPTVITGPAGCGKSIVITERIKNLCEKGDYTKSLKILLTTFNIGLSACLAEWLENMLNKEKVRREGNSFFFHDSLEPNIKIMHFDILTTRIGGFRNSLKFEPDYKHYLNGIITKVCEEENCKQADFEDILNPSFLYDEYVRVIYGQQHETLEQYREGKRIGRPYRLSTQIGDKRDLIWRVTRRCLEYMENRNFELIHTRRHKMLRAIRDGEIGSMFTHIFVDEFQDCTQADYQIFYGLLENNNNLVIAGDFAQAVHLGKTASIPREDTYTQGQEKMRNWLTRKLEGSYRLPFRISQCIRPLSEELKVGKEESDIITPYKGSPPGARPIVVYAKDAKEMCRKIAWVLWYFSKYDIVDYENPRAKGITILERDNELCRHLNNYKPNIAITDTVLKLKGLEKECIVWSTRSRIKADEAINYVYTILTRTSSILIIALYPDVKEQIKEALCLLNQEYLMMWDAETEVHFKTNYKQSTVVQETDKNYSQL